MNKKGFGAGTIKVAIVMLIMLTVFLSILPSLIDTSQTAVGSLATELNNSAQYGTSAAAIGAKLDDWVAYFWVVGPLVLIITLVMNLFFRRR